MSSTSKGLQLLLLILPPAILIVAVTSRPDVPTDFAAFYLGGKMLIEGHGHELYDLALQLREQARFAPPGDPRFFAHPPFEALLFVPLAQLPYQAAYLLWGLANILGLGLTVYLLRDYLTRLDSVTVKILLAAALIYPLRATLFEGQDLLWLLLACTWAFLSLKNGKDFAAGCALGCGLFRFQFVLPFLLAFAIARRWKVLAGAALVGASLAAISFAIVGPSLPVQYMALARFYANVNDSELLPHMPNIQGFVSGILAGGEGRLPWLQVAVIFASLVTLVWCLAKWHRRKWEPLSPEFDLLFSLNVVVCVMVSYHAFLQYLILLALPLILFVRLAQRAGVAVLAAFVAVTLAVILSESLHFSWLLVTLAVFAMAISFKLGRSRRASMDDANPLWP